MRIARIQRNGEHGVAVPVCDGVRAVFGEHAAYDLDSIVRADVGQLHDMYLGCLGTGATFAEDEVEYLPPLVRPSKILCVGLNYRDHASEVELAAPDKPVIFARFPSSLTAHNCPLVKPTESDQFDWEGEMVVVIGKPGRHIPPDRALEHVGAYSVFNDGSVRDFQMHSTQWTMGKSFDHTGAFGPWLVTPDELPPGAEGLQLITRVNGQVVQSASTADMIFDVATLISYLSTAMTLEAGDIIVTGTPPGVGMARTPPVYLGAGDVCEVEVERIGLLRNPVVAAAETRVRAEPTHAAG